MIDAGPLQIPNAVSGQPIAPQAPFVWGQGGARLTPEELARRQQIASALMQSDFSPVGSVWEGLGRVANNISGALDQRSLDREQEAVSADRNSQIAALLGEGNADLAPGLGSTDPTVNSVAQSLLGQRIKTPAQPYRFEDNAGNVWSVGTDGQPQRIFTDVVPKYYIQGDQAIEVPNPFNATQQAAPVQGIGATLPQGWTIDNGDGGSNAAGGFPRR